MSNTPAPTVATLTADKKRFSFTAQDIADLLVQVPLSDLFQILATHPEIKVFGISGLSLDNGRDPAFPCRLTLTYSAGVDERLGDAFRETFARLYGEQAAESPDGARVVLIDPRKKD